MPTGCWDSRRGKKARFLGRVACGKAIAVVGLVEVGDGVEVGEVGEVVVVVVVAVIDLVDSLREEDRNGGEKVIGIESRDIAGRANVTVSGCTDMIRRREVEGKVKGGKRRKEEKMSLVKRYYNRIIG